MHDNPTPTLLGKKEDGGAGAKPSTRSVPTTPHSLRTLVLQPVSTRRLQRKSGIFLFSLAAAKRLLPGGGSRGRRAVSKNIRCDISRNRLDRPENSNTAV